MHLGFMHLGLGFYAFRELIFHFEITLSKSNACQILAKMGNASISSKNLQQSSAFVAAGHVLKVD